ncbi:PadR family transcriptional regulator [Pyrococcus yayanosii]|uniref:Transcriptional regulator, PadR family protein n=1 Tax=Pyrococcus yayanosii (strain CH1 / JCM 16557) TaxID=529709 RepID=F8AGQ6_PYRYC|nr:PadR family transcriptional regulator [Pyrococcus yayanosii]AEH24032.1 transcriptional regulator, PadR family protein [Pyrococcus yayanosii CH1]
MERPRLRGYLKLLILHMLRENPMHGYAIMSELEKRYGIPGPSAGAVYPVLSELKRLGLIEVTGQGKREKKVYSITQEGFEFLEENKGKLEEILRKVEAYKEFSKLGGRELAKTMKELLEKLPEMSEEEKEKIREEILEFTRKIRLILLGGD